MISAKKQVLAWKKYVFWKWRLLNGLIQAWGAGNRAQFIFQLSRLDSASYWRLMVGYIRITRIPQTNSFFAQDLSQSKSIQPHEKKEKTVVLSD
jgi:hypothetical protein